MGSPATAPSVPVSIDDVREKVRSSDFFALCYLMLCQLGYTNENDGPTAIDQITRLLPTMPVPDGTLKDKGQWRLGWGPVVPSDNSNSNLMYAAELVDTGQDPPVSAFSAIVIRGTDTQAKPSGVIKQIIQDLDAANQVSLPFPNPDPNAKIAQGSELGFTILQGFADSGRNLEQYINDFLGENPEAPIVVTGHSLGGCLTTVMGLNLALKFSSAAIVPNTFAAPSAGNSAFIQLYEEKCTFSPRWVNTFDLVPKAFANLGDIKDLWTTCNRPAPLLVKIAVDGLELLLDAAKATYTQESVDESRALQGVCQSSQKSPVSPAAQAQAVVEIRGLLQQALKKHLAEGRMPEILQNLAGEVQNSPLGGALEKVADHLVPQAAVDLVLQHLPVEDLTNWVQELLFQHSVLTGYWDKVQQHSKDVAFIDNPFTK